jgi:pyruvate dehydrogenase E1 component alpha subunit
MLTDSFDSLKGEMLQIMDQEGVIVRPDLMPHIDQATLMGMYETMMLSRAVDIKTLQFQRQGRMLTYAPNLGQEAAQVGSIAATLHSDWMASAFRELGAWLYRSAPLENILLYWFGNEFGMKMPVDVKILPVSIPIASQFQHATGLAYASVLKGETDITIAYVGDGGTSQGDFHEALNFAAVMNTPNVFVIQNNQYAISVPRHAQTMTKTLAQKAIAYGMPGIYVDGNDVFAMYAATKEAVDRARSGQGPTLIEAYTYRIGAHTTADDPTKYRSDDEVKAWEVKDPIKRLKNYLMSQSLWDEERDNALKIKYEDYVKTEFEKVEKYKPVSLAEVFDYNYATRTPALEAQYEERKNYYEKEGIHANT